jgi:hypothetical protein
MADDEGIRQHLLDSARETAALRLVLASTGAGAGPKSLQPQGSQAKPHGEALPALAINIVPTGSQSAPGQAPRPLTPSAFTLTMQ